MRMEATNTKDSDPRFRKLSKHSDQGLGFRDRFTGTIARVPTRLLKRSVHCEAPGGSEWFLEAKYKPVHYVNCVLKFQV